MDAGRIGIQISERFIPETPAINRAEYYAVIPENSHAVLFVVAVTDDPMVSIFTAEAPTAELDPSGTAGDASSVPAPTVRA